MVTSRKILLQPSYMEVRAEGLPTIILQLFLTFSKGDNHQLSVYESLLSLNARHLDSFIAFNSDEAGAGTSLGRKSGSGGHSRNDLAPQI